MRQAVALLNDEDVDANSSSSSKRPSTFLNFVALGNTFISNYGLPIVQSAGKSAVLNSLIGHLALPTGEGGATRAPICIELKRDGEGEGIQFHGMLRVVQQSLLGSILANMLLVLECTFFCGGIFLPKKEHVLQPSCDELRVAVNGSDGSLCNAYYIWGLLLLILGNAAEHASAIMFVMNDKLDISLRVAIGSSTQISMFVIPFCVVVGWIMGHPLDLNFQLFETTTLIMTVLVVAFMLQDGTSNYFKGVMLVFCYLIVAASFFVHIDPLSIRPKKLEWDWTIVLPDLLLSMDVVVFGNGIVDVVVVVIVVVPQSTKSKP
ncbi:vacuolar cation/proton exchanger 2-like [Lactuca sativa]|uniref:vacuolar cation/proton exchanger 2-like n=1 Tax=Lactuca sativa TaxID=4236 RepID=UPI0022AFCFD7|nr:vacuolar cation/proton exchanger 2-like [Lactuca sativa]